VSVKESSDELNPPEPVAESLPVAPISSRSLADYLALAIATCGVGYLPLAPGTWGSLLAVGIYLMLHRFSFPYAHAAPSDIRQNYIIQLFTITVVTIVGTWAASRTERVSKTKDPSKVVIDEVAGQLIALLAVRVGVWNINDFWWLVSAFILFRFFDIVKPYPARKMESLKGGLGIMADDLVAGVYAAIVVAILVASL
jgi:phosphatidylglycerophosphatase A